MKQQDLAAIVTLFVSAAPPTSSMTADELVPRLLRRPPLWPLSSRTHNKSATIAGKLCDATLDQDAGRQYGCSLQLCMCAGRPMAGVSTSNDRCSRRNRSRVCCLTVSCPAA